MPRAIIALGSNLGDPQANLLEAVRHIAAHGKVIRQSSHYRTKAMYEIDQPDFCNAAVLIETEMSPLALFHSLKEIEARMGRVGSPRNAARIIDLDVISYGCLIYEFWGGNEKVLAIPHERVTERRFVLEPLHEISPQAYLPGLGNVEDLLARTDSDSDNVRMVKEDAALSI